MKFKYKAITSSGQKIEGVFNAASEEDVVTMIKGNSYLPVKVERDIGQEAQIEIFKSKVKKKDLALFCRQFFTMLDSGLGIVKCLDILEMQTENKTLKPIIGEVNGDVQKGLSLSEAMNKYPDIFPTILTNMVEAGEVSGNLDAILERMAVHFEKENKLENKIRSSMVYPIALLVVSIAVVIFMITFILPTFTGMFAGSGVEIPWPTRVLLGMSDFIKSYWYILLGILGLMTFTITTFKKSEAGRAFFDGLKLKLPVIKGTTVKIITSRFTRTLSTLMDSGIPLIKSMEVVAKVVNNLPVEEKIEDGIEEIRKGVPLSRAIQNVGVFPPMVDSMIRIGEESGSLDEVLLKTADFYDEEVETSLTKLTTLIEPIMIVGMAIVIGFIVIAMYLPMFDMMKTI
ncbi:type II secretion system F family protein [Gudongella oleilytica]|uniref:type II secretion system F family protein n=1 Tax=Gudongella oleilytica TaxID=1582259 RepID=UPI002A36C497|nr:type II secretion system F family protein [Gudongella oleilytica]MDY0255705.1 type II secretion system F family protein [Gudongella oleilytica]